MRVSELRKIIDCDQRVIVEDAWAKFVDTGVYDSDICSDDIVKRIYIDHQNTLHIVVK